MVRMKVDVTGATSNEAWSNLLDLVCSACDCKRDNGGNVNYPTHIFTSSSGGSIECIEESEAQKKPAQAEA